MPEISVCVAPNGDVVDPHVEVGPVDSDEKGSACKTSIALSLRDDESNAESDFNDASHVNPKGWVAENCGDNWLEPSRIGEVVNADIDVHSTKNQNHDKSRPFHKIQDNKRLYGCVVLY